MIFKIFLLTVFFPFRVIENGEKNRMTYQSIAIVFGPTLLKPEKETGNIAVHTVYQNQIVELILLELSSIFGRWFLLKTTCGIEAGFHQILDPYTWCILFLDQAMTLWLCTFWRDEKGMGESRYVLDPNICCFVASSLRTVCNFELILSLMFAFHTLNFSKDQNLQF